MVLETNAQRSTVPAALLEVNLYKWHGSHVRLRLVILIRDAHNHLTSLDSLIVRDVP